MASSETVRDLYLSYFEEKGHLRIPSSSLVPHGDPTLLFTTAGMVQMKPYFLGEMPAPHPRLTSVQKSFRTTDIDEVGDLSHNTFFEMLGNFSVGDYFKEGAIQFAWELLTQRFKLPAAKLKVSIYPDDDEAEGIWKSLGMPADRIVRLKDNWWGPAGDSGPCGPDSEIYYDKGADLTCAKGPDCGPSDDDCTRWLEIWNLVFMQYNQDVKGNRTRLAKPNIDTGMGLERVLTVLNGVRSSYDTDIFQPLLRAIQDVTGKTYGRNDDDDWAMRVIADHGRGATFLIADGVTPGNEGRGYVLRRVLRRAIRYGRRLGMETPFLGAIVDATVDKFGKVYPELARNRALIKQTVRQEEERFFQTLTVGLALFEEVVADEAVRKAGVIPGDRVFRLYDTYGFPIDVAEEVARDEGLTIDRVGFEQEMARQRERARAGVAQGELGPVEAYNQLRSHQSQFVGYDKLVEDTYVTGLISGSAMSAEASQMQEVEVILAATPFYPEGGGQVGDSGVIRKLNGEGLIRVRDTKRPLADAHGFIVHRGVVEQGKFMVGDRVRMEVDPEKRADSARNHTATHILHATLREVLGSHVHQAGSLVSPEYLRFDFAHNLALNREEQERVLRIANRRIRDNAHVHWQNIPLREALAKGAMAFFGDKYGDQVRMVSIGGNGDGPFSLELCGGTHVHATGEIGYLHVVGEGSVGSGVRRMEAVTGPRAEEEVERRLQTLESLARRLQVPVAEVEQRLSSLNEELERERRRAQALERALAQREVDVLLSRAELVDGVALVAARVSTSDPAVMREMTDSLRERLGSGIVLLASVRDDRPNLICAVTPDLIGKGYHAGRIVKEVAQMVGGGGGGRADMAQAGGKDASKLDAALAAVKGFVKK